MKQIKKILGSRNVQAALGMFVGTLIYCVGVVWILNLGAFFGGGVTGVSQILTAIFGKFGIHISMSVFVIIINVPLFLIGWKGVSKRFAILTLCSVGLQSLFIFLLEILDAKFGINPFVAFKDNMLTLAILGGLCCGLGTSLALKYGASTGGVDIISQFLSFKKGANFATISFTIDASIVLSTLLLPDILGGVETCVYTIIRHIINMLIVDKVNTTYKMVKISIVTTKKTEMREALLANFQHGITIYEVVGGYSNTTRYVFEAIISRFELEDYRKVAHDVDEKVFISTSRVNSVDGRFTKKAIA